MGMLTIRMPDATHERLKRLARARKVSVNKLIEEFSTAALAEFDAETRFLARSARSGPARGLALLDRVDAATAAQPRAGYTVRAHREKGSKTVKRTRSSRPGRKTEA